MSIQSKLIPETISLSSFNNKTIGQLVRKLRKINKVSVNSLSKITGISAQCLFKFEHNKTDLSSSRLIKLMQLFQIEVKDE